MRKQGNIWIHFVKVCHIYIYIYHMYVNISGNIADITDITDITVPLPLFQPEIRKPWEPGTHPVVQPPRPRQSPWRGPVSQRIRRPKRRETQNPSAGRVCCLDRQKSGNVMEHDGNIWKLMFSTCTVKKTSQNSMSHRLVQFHHDLIPVMRFGDV